MLKSGGDYGVKWEWGFEVSVYVYYPGVLARLKRAFSVFYAPHNAKKYEFCVVFQIWYNITVSGTDGLKNQR